MLEVQRAFGSPPGYVDTVRATRWPLSFVLALGAVALYAAAFFALRVRLYDGLAIGIRDQGFFQQALYNTLHGRLLETSVSDEGFVHLFAEHAYLFVVALLPFFAIVPDATSLFLLEAIAAGAGGFALYIVAQRRLDNGWLGLVVTVAYLLHPALQWANLGLIWYGFHLENFFPPLFLLGVAAADAGRRRIAAGLFLLALSVSEVFAIPVMAYALVRAIRQPQDRRFGLSRSH